METTKQNILRENERKYKTVYELSPEAIGILDTNGTILDMNGRVYDWLSYKPEEIIGKHILEVPYLAKESKIKIKEKFHERMAGKKVAPYEVDFIAKNGERLVGRVLAAPIRDKNREIIGDIVMISDITNLKKKEQELEESEKKYRFLFENAPVGIGIADLKGNVLDSNPEMLKLTGYNLDELRDINLIDTYVDSAKRKHLVEALKKHKQVQNWETELRRKDGSTYCALLNVELIKINSREVILTTARDITEDKKVDQAKTEFVSLASHQLRTPLTNISWYAEVLLRQESAKADKKLKEYLENIYHSNKKLIDLVNALLNVSRIELGTFAIEPEPVNLIRITTDVLKEFLQQIREKKLKVISSYGKDLPIINVDPNLIQVIFQNLFSNAIKYTPKGGTLEILIKKQYPYLLIKISDTGYGIPKDEQSQIFTKFFRANNIVEKEPDGTGLGLYIVKAIIEQSGGKIWFESEENQGTTFYVLISLKGMGSRKGTKQLI